MQPNRLRFKPEAGKGHYESYFQRANHPTRPLAFWVRYTVFQPRAKPDASEAELWAVWFDGEQGKVTTGYRAIPYANDQFRGDGLDVNIDGTLLTDKGMSGGFDGFRWDLTYGAGQKPLFLYPESYYEQRLPKAKVLVAVPLTHYSGTFSVNGEQHTIDAWPGSQNHNWGSKHTDLYAWGQVAGFDNDPDAFLEVASAKLKLGPLWTPMLTPMVLRTRGKEYTFNTPRRLLAAHGEFSAYRWKFSVQDEKVKVSGEMSAPREHFARLDYRNPPAGAKLCLNTKIARCEIKVIDEGIEHTLVSENRAAFEITGDKSTLAKRGF